MKLDLNVMPFSCRGSYFAVSYLTENFRGKKNREGLYWREVHGGSPTDLIARLVPMLGSEEQEYEYTATESELTICCAGGRVSLCFGDEDTLLVRGEGEISLRLEGLGTGQAYTFINRTRQAGHEHYILNCFKNNARYIAYTLEGIALPLQNWDGETSTDCSLQLCPENGTFLCVLKDGFHNCECGRTDYNYEQCRSESERDFYDFCNSAPTVPESCNQARERAAYVCWSAMVKKFGHFTREAMLMSKNWMTLVWSWDNCFNAMALAYGSPREAWDQFMLPFDYQDESGALPDTISDICKTTVFCKPPIHGWTLRRLIETMPVSKEQLREIYPKLARWTDWWFTWRDSDGDGVCEYIHGNDSGWDNSTAFLRVPPTEAPDLAAYLVIQLDVLAEVAGALGHGDEHRVWSERADKALADMTAHLFPEGLPTVQSSTSHETIENRSLLRFLPLLLGERLPEKIRENMLTSLKTSGLYTEHGFATEPPDSKYYVSDGYWRGPIWAPSSLLIIEGLKNCGGGEWAREAAERFCDMVKKSGCAENFDAQTGAGLRDRSHTWTASVFLSLAHEYLTSEE